MGASAESNSVSPMDTHQPEYETTIRLTDVASEMGVSFECRNGEEVGLFSILETVGSGLGWVDFDKDGRFDLFIAGGGTFDVNHRKCRGESPGLFQNMTGSFRAIGQAFDPKGASQIYTHGVHVADYDNDGFEDVLLTGYDGCMLLCNHGDGTFGCRKLSYEPFSDLWNTGAAWGDFNKDGALDIYLTNYVDWSFSNNPPCYMGSQTVCSPIQFDALPDVLMLSDGSGSFVAQAMDAAKTPGKGLGACAADMDQDGDLDIYVANDTTPNFMLENDGAGGLSEKGLQSGTAFGLRGGSDGSMGLSVGDIDRDGEFDLWVTNFEGQSFALYRNVGEMLFQHRSSQLGISSVGAVYVGFGTDLVDLDGDGFKEILCANGHVTANSTNSSLRQVPLLFCKAGVRFRALRVEGYLSEVHRGRGLATSDFDNDGDLDVAISHVNEPVALLKNETPQLKDWTSIQLVGRESPRTPIGAIVAVGEDIDQLVSGSSYLSSHDQRLVFALDTKAGEVTAKISWPSGIEQEVTLPNSRNTIVVEPSN